MSTSELREHYLDRMRATLAGLTRCPHGVVRETTACHACDVAVKAAEHADKPAPDQPTEPESTEESA